MDIKGRAWKLRNSSEIWRPNKHILNNDNALVARGKQFRSDNYCHFSATMLDSERSQQAKWNSNSSFSQDKSNIESTSSSPILLYRALSPDLCRARSIDSMKIPQKVHQTQNKTNITCVKNDELSKYVACANLELKSSTGTLDTMITNKNSATSHIWIKNHQQPPCTTSSSQTILTPSSKGVVGISTSVSTQMWQENQSLINNETNKIQRCQSQGVIRKQESDAKNIIYDKKEISPTKVDQPHMENQDIITLSSMRDPNALRSSEQCITMRMNMAFEPIVGMKSYKYEHTEEKKLDVCHPTSIREVRKKELIPSEVIKHVTNLERQQEDEVWFQNCSDDSKICTMYSSNTKESLNEESKKDAINPQKCDIMTTELNYLTLEEYLPIVHETIERNFEVKEDQILQRGRRWPKLPPSTFDKSYIERLATSLTTSNNDYLIEESAPKSTIELLEEGSSKAKIKILEEKTTKSEIEQQQEFMIVKSVGCQKNAITDTCNFYNYEEFIPDSTIQKTKKSKIVISSRRSPSKNVNSPSHVRCMNEKLIEKVVVQSSNKWSEEILPTYSSKTSCELKAGGFSLKSKRSLERATLAIIEKKQKDENSQWLTSYEIESKGLDVYDKFLTKVEINSAQSLKNKEQECKEKNDYSLPKLSKKKKMIISGPPDAFREIKMNRMVGSTHLTTIESSSCPSHKSCTNGHQIEPFIQQNDLMCNLQVLESPQHATDCIDLQNVVIVSDSNHNHNASSITKFEEDGVISTSSLSKIYEKISSHYPSKVIARDEKNLNFDDISKTWSKPLHLENESADRISLSSEKFSNILSYLEHVEESNLQDNCKFLQKKDLEQEGNFFNLKSSQSPCTSMEHEDNVSLTNSTHTTSLTNISNIQSKDGEVYGHPTTSLFEGVKKKMQEFKSRIAAKESHNVKLLQDIEILKTDKAQALSLERDRFGQELEARATEYKAAIQHHLDLNEKMVKDKEVLSNKCCNLVVTINTVEQKYDDKIKMLKEQFAQELKKQKEIWIAGEKPRREAWKEKKIKEIKELTIKGLEPHIDGLNEKHKQEIKRLERRFSDEMQKKLEVHSIQHRQEICELRSRILKERDEIVEKERFATLTRFNDVAEKYEQQAMELRRKVSSDMTMELEKLEEARRWDKQVAHDILTKAREEWNNKEATLKDSLEKSTRHAVVEKDAVILSLQSELERFKTDWQNDFDEKLIKDLRVQEDEFKSRCTKERDEQIEMIIEKMEREKDEAIAQHQQELLIKVETLMEEKLELMKKLKEVESKCAKLCKMSLEAKEKAEMEITTQDLQVESLRREALSQADLTKQLKTQIQQEKKFLQEQEQRYELQLAKEHELIQTKQLEVERCNEETQQLRLRKVKELEEVEMHVKKAIESKDQIIAGLREQLIAAREQIRHTQLLLQQEHVAFLADPD